MERVKLVVVNENMLGYITPNLPNYVGILRSSILRGATYPENCGPYLLSPLDKTRLASEKDFDEAFGTFLKLGSIIGVRHGLENVFNIFEN